jgi:predicted AAA+ superfamily ATPase
MKRNILDDLLLWKNDAMKKPIVMFGARQVGKTHTIDTFGKEYYGNYIKIDIEKDSKYSDLFDLDLNPKRIIQELEVRTNTKIIPNDTLIFFDEIQSNPKALNSLKYFYEDAPEYHIISAGSLLGVAINNQGVSFPVGKVKSINMYPLSFFEFMHAVGHGMLVDKIKECYEQNETLSQGLHIQALDLYKKYLIIGGMPEAVNVFLERESVFDAKEIQDEILSNYANDMTKYASTSESVKIRACFDSIPIQLAKPNQKFQYKVVKNGGSSTIFGSSLDWLVYSGLGLKCYLFENVEQPLSIQKDLTNFKLYMLDSGLLISKAKMDVTLISKLGQVDNTFLGPIAENYVANVLAQNDYELMYWSSGNTAEIDFAIENKDGIIPIEVKAGKRIASKSLGVFVKTYKPKYSIRLSIKNFGFENGIKSVPLYAATCI